MPWAPSHPSHSPHTRTYQKCVWPPIRAEDGAFQWQVCAFCSDLVWIAYWELAVLVADTVCAVWFVSCIFSLLNFWWHGCWTAMLSAAICGITIAVLASCQMTHVWIWMTSSHVLHARHYQCMCCLTFCYLMLIFFFLPKLCWTAGRPKLSMLSATIKTWCTAADTSTTGAQKPKDDTYIPMCLCLDCNVTDGKVLLNEYFMHKFIGWQPSLVKAGDLGSHSQLLLYRQHQQ